MDRYIPRDAALLIARTGLSILFLVMGWGKLADFNGAVSYMAATHAPFPALSAAIATVVELGIGLSLVAGFMVTPLALLLAGYTIVTGFIGHHFWTMEGMLRYDMMIHFYKNIAIAGGLVALAVAGAGRYSISLLRGKSA